MKGEEIPLLSGFLSPQRQASSNLESRGLMLFLEEDKLRHKESQDGWRGAGENPIGSCWTITLAGGGVCKCFPEQRSDIIVVMVSVSME